MSSPLTMPLRERAPARESPTREAAYAAADACFRTALWDDAVGAAPRAYLIGTRQIASTVARDSGIGYFPFHTSHPAMRAVAPSGTDEGGFLTFPIRSADGTIRGFKFRAVPGVAVESAPRYTGTSGEMQGAMFGWHLHQPTDRHILAIEGEVDQLSLATARLTHPDLPLPLAWYGNTLTEQRLAWLLEKDIAHVLLALDADAGGWDGVLRAGRKLAAAGIAHDVLQLPRGMDPNDVLQAGGGDILAHFIQRSPRIPLLVAHARQLARDGLAEADPFFVRAALADTARATIVFLTPEIVHEAARCVQCPVQMFAGVLDPALLSAGTRVRAITRDAAAPATTMPASAVTL